MITRDGNMLAIPGWEEHQNIEGMDKIREQNRIRKQKQRERQKLAIEQDMSRDSSRDVTQQNKIKNKKEELDKEVLVARNEEIEKAYQKGKEDGISRTVSVLNKVVENAREEEREKSYNAGFEQGFTDGQDWANVENSVTLLLALHRAYDFEPEQLMNVVEKSNKYVHQANEGKPTIGTLARQLYNECQIKLCEHEVEILRKHSLFEEGDPYD